MEENLQIDEKKQLTIKNGRPKSHKEIRFPEQHPPPKMKKESHSKSFHLDY
jgi:hypothetical protein